MGVGMGEVIRNGDSIALAGDSSPPYLLGEGGKGKGGEGRSIFRLLVENDFEVGKWVLERYRKEGAGGKTGEKQGKGGWEAFLLEIDQQGEGKLLDFFRELVREELERDCSTPLRAASPVTHFFAIFLELFPLDFLWKILKKMGKRIQIQGSKTLDIMEEVSNVCLFSSFQFKTKKKKKNLLLLTLSHSLLPPSLFFFFFLTGP